MSKSKPLDWASLDNAGKIFPPTVTKRDQKVFRVACELKDKINPTLLTTAVEKAMIDFPVFRMTLKRGLFWYYLEESNLKAVIEEENIPLCTKIYDKNVKSLLFRVHYFNKRINLEVYHALTDGTGAIEFLKSILYYYLLEKNPKINQDIKLDFDASFQEKKENSFEEYYQNPTPGKSKHQKAYKIKGLKIPEYRIDVISGIISVKELKVVAKEHQTTITVLLTAILMKAVQQTKKLRQRDHPTVINVPVNLRQYFPSRSVRNFFGLMKVRQQSDFDIGDLDETIKHISNQFEEELKKENVERRMQKLVSLEHNIITRSVPLFIKDIALRIAAYFGEIDETMTLSNVGIIKMPKEFEEEINLFEVFVSTNTLQACVTSFKDHLVVSFTSPLVSTEIQKNFFRELENLGMTIELRTNKTGGAR